MSTIPSLALIPSGYKGGSPKGTLYSVLPTDGSGDFDFTRSGNATRVNSDGLIEVVSTNVPRLNYPLIDGVVQGCPSLLLEPTRTNLFLRSEEFENAYWSKGNATVTENTTTAPDGTLTADKLTASTTGTDRRIQRTDSLAAGTYTTSIFVKSAELNTVRMYAVDFSSQATFNLSEGTVSSILGGATANIENYGNGWYRCSITITYSGGSTQTLYLNIGNALGGATINAGDGVFIWGAQLEAGTYATSYIPTQGATATRVAETCNQTTPSGIIGQTEGSVYFEVKPTSTLPSYTQRIITLYEDSSNLVTFQLGSSNELTFVSVKSGESAVVITKSVPALNLNSFNKIACSISANNFVFYVNGVKVGEDTTVGKSMPSVSNIIFANYNNTNPFLGSVKDLRLYNTALTDQELINLTTI